MASRGQLVCFLLALLISKKQKETLSDKMSHLIQAHYSRLIRPLEICHRCNNHHRAGSRMSTPITVEAKTETTDQLGPSPGSSSIPNEPFDL